MEPGAVWIDKLASIILVPLIQPLFPRFESFPELIRLVFLGALLPGILLLPLLLQETRLKTRVILFLFLVAFSPAVVSLFHLELFYLSLEEFFTFVSLMVLLYAVSSGMEFHFEYRGTPSRNTLYLLLGAILTNLMGSIGATLLLIRPFLKANEGRSRQLHLPLFFILVVSNGSALLSPLAGSHLYMGVVRGLPLEFYASLLPVWLFVTGTLLLLFFLTDLILSTGEPVVEEKRSRLADRLYRSILNKQVPQSLLLDLMEHMEKPAHSLTGVVNLIFLALGLGVLYFANSQGAPFPVQEVALLLLSFVMFVFIQKSNRKDRAKDLQELLESTIFYYVVFLVLTPFASPMIHSMLDHIPGDRKNLYLLSGLLAGFVDNLPASLLFLDPHVVSEPMYDILVRNLENPHLLEGVAEYGGPAKNLRALLTAMSLTGGLSVTGNLMNLYVRKVARDMGFPFPGFFRYILYALPVVAPVFWLTGWLFFF